MRTLSSALVAFALAAAAPAATTVSGTVRDAVTGTPLAGARIEAGGTGTVVTSGPDGAFRLTVEARELLTVTISLSAYQVRRLEVSLPALAPLDVDLVPVVSFSDRIEVTATRAREGHDPVSFTNVPQQRIQEAYWAQDPAMLLPEVAPGVFSYNDNGNGIGYSYFTIRGFGQSRTRVTLNGAPLNDAESGELFFIDLADFLTTSGDIQLQRGVFGLSGLGGAVDITTAAPDLEPSFALRVGGGSFATQRMTVVYDSGIIDGTWALTARYSKVSTDGYRDQSWVDMWNYYLSLTRFGTRSTWRINLFGGPEQTHLAYYGVPMSVLAGALTGDRARDRRHNPLTYPGEIDSFEQPHYQFVHDLEVSDHTHLAQTVYLFQGDGHYDQFKEDRRLAEYNLPDATLPDGSVVTHTDLVRRRAVDEWDAGWVPTVRHSAGDWTLTARGEARFHRAHHTGTVTWAATYPDAAPDNRYYDYQVEKRSLTVAGLAAWHVSERITLTGGLQFTTHRYEMGRDRVKSVELTERYDFALPRLGAVASLGEGAEVYAQLSRGGREPNFRNIYDPQDYWATRAELEPESLWDIEAGVSLRRPRWRLRANAYFMPFDNEIVWAGALDDSGVPVYANGARSVHRGLEIDAGLEITPQAGIDAALTLSRNTFQDYREFDWEGGAMVYDGNRIAGYPDLIASLSGRVQTGSTHWLVSARHVGRLFLDNTEDNRRDPESRGQPGYVTRVNPAFTLVDVAARSSLPAAAARALGMRRVLLEARVNNLLDEEYTAFGYVDAGEPMFIPAAGRNVFVGLTLGI